MKRNELLFYNEYEQFYMMAESSAAFHAFCEMAFGRDLSQDGFSDMRQINRILQYIPRNRETHILDVGCGNGKMLGYLQAETGAYIHGFDYSENAVKTARTLFPINSEFIQACIGEADYPDESFDVITSMDTIYFAPDMSAFIDRLIRWLKNDGTLFVCYQDGDVMPKTESANTTVLAKVLQEKSIPYECIDITKETYDLLLRKRKAAMAYKKEFEQEGNAEWFDMLIDQTEYANRPYEEFSEIMARYIYVMHKK